mgnify:CR=1 FL=1
MVKRHLSRLRAPRSWSIKRKGIHFITRSRAGAHSLEESMPLSLLLTNVLAYAQTQKEVKKILAEGKILVNNKVRKDHALAVGLMDVVHVPALNETYRILYTKKGELFALRLAEKEKDLLPLKIENKTLLKGGKIQLNYANGSNQLIEKDTYKTGDTLVRSLSNGTIIEHLPFAKGARVYITGGKNVGRIGVLEDVQENTIMVTSDTETFKTAKAYAFVIGPYLTLTQ